MANRKRGQINLPEELKTNEHLYTKTELALMNLPPCCPPVPLKVRRNYTVPSTDNHPPKPITFNGTSQLSPMFNPDINQSYLNQMFVRVGYLGEGSFGMVHKSISLEDNELYAIKHLKPSITYKDCCAEIRNNEKVGIHENIVRFYMGWEENTEIFMMLEYCPMSLAKYARKNNKISEEMLWFVLYDMCKALNHLHKSNLVHLDVKPENIMMKNGYYKLGDFGLLIDLNLNSTFCKSTLSDGDAKYLAMEVLQGVYTPSCDIFGLGISLLELAADLELPKCGPLWQQLRHQLLPLPFYNKVSLGFQIIIERMMVPDYSKRPTAEAMLKYKTIKEVERTDKKKPRIDYAAPYLNNEEDQAMPPLKIPLYNKKVLPDLYTSNRNRPLAARRSLWHIIEGADESISLVPLDDTINNNEEKSPTSRRSSSNRKQL